MGGIEGEGEGGIGDEKWIEVTVDMPGQRDDDATVVFLAQMIHEGLVADGWLKNRLVINARWHWRLYIDVGTPIPIPFPTTTTTISPLNASIHRRITADTNGYITDPPPLPTPHLPSPPPLPNHAPRPPLHPLTSARIQTRRRPPLQRRLGRLHPTLPFFLQPHHHHRHHQSQPKPRPRDTPTNHPPRHLRHRQHLLRRLPRRTRSRGRRPRRHRQQRLSVPVPVLVLGPQSARGADDRSPVTALRVRGGSRTGGSGGGDR